MNKDEICKLENCTNKNFRKNLCRRHYQEYLRKRQPKRLTDGRSKNLNYSSYYSMVTRCTNPKHRHYKHYGERGITICERWIDRENGFINFVNDMGDKPTPKHSIDRIDVNGNYCPENCRWATQKEQMLNTRSNIWIEFKSVNKTISQWAIELNISRYLITHRLNKGYSIEDCFYQGKFDAHRNKIPINKDKKNRT